jgi:hypothetical protein
MGDERTAYPGTTAEESQSSVDLGSHHAAGVQPGLLASPAWWALNILFVFAGVTQLIALQYRHGLKGMLVDIAPGPHDLAIAAASYAGRNNAGHQYGNGFWQRKPGVQRLAAITAVLSLICLNGLSHPGYARRNIITGHAAYSGIPLAVVSFCRQICPEGRRRFMPRNFFYYAYAGHLGLLVWYSLLLADLE